MRRKGLIGPLLFALAMTACGGGGGGGGGGITEAPSSPAAAPPMKTTAAVDLPRTGQTATFAAGDDATLAKGVAWPDPRFTDNGNGTVTDNLTGLIWLKKADCIGPRNWADALAAMNALASGQCALTDGSRTGDWRLPNRKELRSLVDYSETGPALPAVHPFINVNVQDVYWTSSTVGWNTYSVLILNMASGHLSLYFKGDGGYALPVRAERFDAPASVPKSGQTTMYTAGDDGDLEKGVAWPGPRFTVDGAGLCVTDNLTDLMWVRTPDDTARTWADALTYANGLTLCGHDDWRLPNVNELESLVNAEVANISLWLNMQGFSNVLADYYWSSSTCADSADCSWVVSMNMGNVYTSFRTSANRVLPVRDAGAAPSPLAKTGQTTCYGATGSIIDCAGTGQDGEFQKGAAWPSPRFSFSNDGTIRDNLTGLLWLEDIGCVNPQGQLEDWLNALDSANRLNTGECGLSDGSSEGEWRIPNRKELRSLINYEEANSATWLNGLGLINVVPDGYWSSSTYAYNPNWAFIGSMVTGSLSSTSKTVGFLMWPVRAGGGAPAGLAETGQTTCYNSAGAAVACAGTGQDGDKKAGDAWPAPRFIDYRDGTIKDGLTGLIWLKDADCFKTRTWQQALSDANGLENGACGLSDGSAAGDWRLPNVNELESLFNAESSGIELLSGQGFINVGLSYWSSTTSAKDPASAIAVIGDGTIQATPKALDPYPVWPVRDRK